VDVSHIEQCTFRTDDFSMTDSVHGLWFTDASPESPVPP
jgi:hypothetical protein